MIPDDDMTAAKWRSEAPAIGEGWEAAEFPIADTAADNALDTSHTVFGWTKGSFGVFEGNGQTQIGALELSSLTHRRSGKRIALFTMPEDAALAGDLAERVGKWAEMDGNGLLTEEWRVRARQMFALWQQAGLICGPVISNGRPVWCSTEPMEKGPVS